MTFANQDFYVTEFHTTSRWACQLTRNTRISAAQQIIYISKVDVRVDKLRNVNRPGFGGGQLV